MRKKLKSLLRTLPRAEKVELIDYLREEVSNEPPARRDRDRTTRANKEPVRLRAYTVEEFLKLG